MRNKDFFILKEEMKRYGTSYGGYYLPEPLPLNKDSVIYSFGAGEDISFDVELAYATGAKVHIFDFTPRAIQHVNTVKDFYDDRLLISPSKRYGGGDKSYLTRLVMNRVESEQLVLHPYGLFTEDCSLPFYFPENPEYVSLSAKREGKSDKTLIAPVKSLETIMLELKHDHIDVLKLDIECVELEVLDQLLRSDIRPRFLAVDFDSARSGKSRECVDMVKRLDSAGYKILNFDNWDVSFSLRQ